MFGPGTDNQQHASLRIDMVGLSSSIILGDKNRHVLPIRSVGQKIDDTPQGEVVIGHPGSDVRVPLFRFEFCSMIAAERNVEEGRKAMKTSQKPSSDIFHEPVSAVLVGDVHV